jgi:hypothetical protein
VDEGEADTVLASLRIQQMRFDEAATALARAFHDYQTSPWATTGFKKRALDLAETVGGRNPRLAGQLFSALQTPFSVAAVNEQRLMTRTKLAQVADFKGLCRDAIAPLEQYVPWNAAYLSMRRDCYAMTGDSRLTQATRDVVDYVAMEPLPLNSGLPATQSLVP